MRKLLVPVFGGMVVIGAIPVVVFLSAPAHAMPGPCNPAAYAPVGPGPQACAICSREAAAVGRDLGCYWTPPGSGPSSTGFADCDAMPNVRDRVICGDQHLTGQR
jgi:hypothetical protein